MSHPKAYATECQVCTRIAVLRARASEVEQVVVRAGSAARRNGELEQTPLQLAAMDWSLSVVAYLRREMEPHPRCFACSILMGQGHLEAGVDQLCGTCRVAGRSVPGDADRGPEVAEAIGRRGWHSDNTWKANGRK